MDRKLRRNLSKRKWLSRAKKIYDSCKKLYIPIKGIKSTKSRYIFDELKICESITEFLNDSKEAKILKSCTTPYSSKIMQQEYKRKNKKNRYKAKKDIQEEIQEYEFGDNYSEC